MDVLGSIGFYTLSDERCRRVSREPHSPMSRGEILLGSRCNFSCPYCRRVGGPDASPSDVRRALQYWVDDGLRAMRFSGGEPTLWGDLPYVVELAASTVPRVAVSTNGSAPWPTYERLLSAGTNDFSVSLDACCAADGRVMTGVEGAWEVVIENIRRLSARAYVTVGVVLTEYNKLKINEIVEFAESLGVADVRPIPSAQYDEQVEVGELAATRSFPILRWRWERMRRGLPARGIGPSDSRRCSLVLDDSAVAGGEHYPCIIYLREGGSPIGRVGPSMRRERVAWSEEHDSAGDPICSRYCLDFCVQHNNRAAEFRGLLGLRA